MKVSRLPLKLQALILQAHNLKTSNSLALVFMCAIGLVERFLECVSMLVSDLRCESYECFNEGNSIGSQTINNDFTST